MCQVEPKPIRERNRITFSSHVEVQIVEVQVLDEANVFPLQDVNTEEFLKEIGFVLDGITLLPAPPTDSVESYPIQHLDLGMFPQDDEKQLICPLHGGKLKKCTSRNGWEFLACPKSKFYTNCYLMTGIHEAGK